MRELSYEDADLFLFLCYPTYIDTDSNKMGEMTIFSLPDLHDFDGAVIFGSGLDFKEVIDDLVTRSNEAGIPVIIQGARREGISFVGSDNYQATKDMCGHLINEHGVKKITFFAGTKDSYDSELRLNAIRDYLNDIGCEDYLQEIYYTNWENAAAERRINEIFANGETLPDVIICANDGLAMATCSALFNNGAEVPDEVLVTGYDFLEDSQVFHPSIASVDQCFAEMGEAAIKLWRKLIDGVERESSEVVSCKFIPGESCSCYEFRNSDMIRRLAGRAAFSKRSMTTYFNRKLDIIDSTILSCYTYQELKNKLNQLLTENHSFEGDSFHVILEPNFGLSIYDSEIKLNTERYSRNMEVLYSTEDGEPFVSGIFSSHDLIPGYNGDGVNHLYAFLPLHEADSAYGYLIFRDCLDKVGNRFLHNYQNRMSLVLDKFRHALTLDIINKRLLDIMRRDPLTKVNNRMAFEDKVKFLQSMINSESDQKFAVAVFDVNNLKIINDSEGHEAGDRYLIRACHLICNVFKHSPVFRVGGDEFIVIINGEDYDSLDELKDKFNSMLSPYTGTAPLPSDYVSVAIGIAPFIAGTDFAVQDVIKRADEEMYKDKIAKKSSG